ncbi:MAG: ABC transporter permease [Clostridia bacterium]|nr:ABC transporter permease [Clostridia bacterium]MBQ8971923.1 ABC transporter permease [Clostridia bacterium]
MKNTIKQVFHSPKFVVGFVIIMAILLLTIIYPIFNPGDPLQSLFKGSDRGSFTPPGTYVSLYDAVTSFRANLDNNSDAYAARASVEISDDDWVLMVNWFTGMDIDISGLDRTDTDAVLKLWKENYSDSAKPKGMTKSARNSAKRLNESLSSLGSEPTLSVTSADESKKVKDINATDYVPVNRVASVVRLPLGTDTFGRDVLKELVSAIGTSLMIGLVAGVIATFIGLMLGLLSGYIGGFVDDLIMFVTNIFTVIPSFILLILINYSIGQEARGAMVVAVVIGLTSWTWTTRSVRSQVISLRNRDHVNLSKLSGHSLFRIIMTDILPYIMSYVVMAFILQISSAILSEAQLSLLGLGPSTTKTATLGLMMNWAMLYSAHLAGSWWAYFPVIGVIALISFSLNLMNTGLDQVFNPTLRD